MGQFFPFSGVQHIFAFVGAETKFSFFLCHMDLQQAVDDASCFDSLLVDLCQ